MFKVSELIFSEIMNFFSPISRSYYVFKFGSDDVLRAAPVFELTFCFILCVCV